MNQILNTNDVTNTTTITFQKRVVNHINIYINGLLNNLSYFYTNWILSTNHRRIAVMYFLFVVITAFSGLLLATIIRIELAYPGKSFLNNNAEKYLTIISLHGIVMVFFVVIPALFGAFGNFLLPTQLGVRDVAFPRLNSFMFWVTPSGFILLMHIFFFDKNTKSQFLTCTNNKNIFLNRVNLNKNLVNNIYYNNFILENIFNKNNYWLHYKEKNKVSYLLKNIINKNIKHDSFYSNTIKNNCENNSSYFLNILNNEREFFRLVDILNTSSGFSNFSFEFFNNIYSKKIVTIKLSSWVSNQLIPGWAFITPYSSRLKFSSMGKVDIALIVVFSAGLGSIFSAVNYVITYRCVSSPLLKNRRELRSFFADSLLVGSRMMLAANPALLIAILFLLSDRHLGTSIFDFSGGGDAVLFQHLFWFFGHPEVYIIIIPCFGFSNSLLPHFLRKRLSGRLSLQFSMYTIAFMSFAVWGHHMYMVGLANTTRTLYSTMTVMISVPASTKVLHWCVTLVNSAPSIDISFFFLLAFTYFFTLGGLSGMFVAHMGFDVLFHDTFYVIGHFHVMFAGAAASCIFAAFYFYFSSIFGIKYSKIFSIFHFFFYFFGQLFTVIPMFWLGYSGMPRRIMDYPSYFGGWHSIISGGHILSLIGFIFFLLMLIDSFFEGRISNQKNLGIARLNTRFVFYAYERKKLLLNSTIQLNIIKNSTTNIYEVVKELEYIEYTFKL